MSKKKRAKVHEDLIYAIAKTLNVLKAVQPGIELSAGKPAWFYAEDGLRERFSVTYRLDDYGDYYEIGI